MHLNVSHALFLKLGIKITAVIFTRHDRDVVVECADFCCYLDTN